MKNLIFWNNSAYTETLEKSFPGSSIVTNIDQYEGIMRSDEKYHSVLVLCELDWFHGHTPVKLQSFKGIELAKEMRSRYNISRPFLFVSFYPLKQILSAETGILTSVGHNFCQLPESPETLAYRLGSMADISQLELKDIQLFSCSPRGIIMEKTHHLEGEVAKARIHGGPEEVKKDLEKCICEIHDIARVSPQPALARFREIYNSDKLKEAIQHIEALGKELIEKYITADTSSAETAAGRKPWKLLLLDDELNESGRLVQLLHQKGVDVICTSNAADATAALAADDSLRGSISLILCDFRLNEHKEGVTWQQKKQGYAFLQDVADTFQGRLLSAVVYSGMPRQFLLETFRSFKIRTEIYSKIDFRTDDARACNFLVNRLIEIGDENYEALIKLPLASRGWADNLHETYLLYRQQADYEKREAAIREWCTKWVVQYRNAETSKDLPPTPMIKGDAFRRKIGEPEKKTLARFEAYYKTRRLAQFLSLFYEMKGDTDIAEKVVCILAPSGKKTKTPAAIRGFFSQIIGFKREEFPFGATIEELSWFEHDLGINVLDDYRKFRHKLDKCEELVGEFIQEHKGLTFRLSESDYIYTDDRKHELLFDRKSFRPCLFDRTDLTLCLNWLVSQENLNQASQEAIIVLLGEVIRPIWNTAKETQEQVAFPEKKNMLTYRDEDVATALQENIEQLRRNIRQKYRMLHVYALESVKVAAKRARKRYTQQFDPFYEWAIGSLKSDEIKKELNYLVQHDRLSPDAGKMGEDTVVPLSLLHTTYKEVAQQTPPAELDTKAWLHIRDLWQKTMSSERLDTFVLEINENRLSSDELYTSDAPQSIKEEIEDMLTAVYEGKWHAIIEDINDYNYDYKIIVTNVAIPEDERAEKLNKAIKELEKFFSGSYDTSRFKVNSKSGLLFVEGMFSYRLVF